MGIPTKVKDTRHCAHRGRVSYFFITGRHRQVIIEQSPQRGLPHHNTCWGGLGY